MSKIVKYLLKTVVFIIFYSIHFFVLSTICSIYDIPTSFFTYGFPIVAIISLSFLTHNSYSISTRFYSYIYYLSTAYLGLVLNLYMFVLVYKSISYFVTLSRMVSTFISIISPIVMSLYGMINARIITTDNVIIKTKIIQETIKIAHLSDLHLGAVYQTQFTTKIVNLIINQIKPDVVIITGDIFDNNFSPKGEWLKPFEKITVPILYVTGNHEEIIGKNEVLKILNKTNIIHIGTNVKGYTIKGVNFFGIDYDIDVKKRINEFGMQKNQLNIVLNHVPSLKPKELDKSEIFLFLCGHSHAGQMIPLHLIDYLISKCFRGLYEENGKYVYVSPGLGTSLFPMRVASSSTIGVITLTKE